MGTLSLAAPWCFSRRVGYEPAPGFTFSLPFIIIPHNITLHKTVTLTVTLTSTDTHPTHNVVCPSGAWFENRPHLTPSIHLAWNPKHIIVQWVGIGTHTHTHITTKNIHVRFVCYLKTRDFYLWSNLKNKVYKTNPHTLDELKQNIRTEISEAELMRVNANFLRRCRRCIDAAHHFQHLLW